MSRYLLLMFLLGVAISQPVTTQARTFGQIYTQCGIGGLIGSAIGGTAGDVTSVITNIIWDLGTTASSSEISSPNTCAGGKATAARFIHDSYDYIASDLAGGQGQHIRSLLQVSGCDAAVWKDATSHLRNDLTQLTTDESYSGHNKYVRAERFFNSFVNTLSVHFPAQCQLT